MGWTSVRTWVTGEIVTASIMNSAVRDNLAYLKGVGQVPTIQSGLVIDNSLGSEYLKLPLLSTAECATVLAAEGQVAHDEQTHRIKVHDGTAVRSLVSTVDVDDAPVDSATTDPISSNWAYDHLNILTTAGDIVYATAARTWVGLPIGTAGQRLKVNAGATAPEWGVTGQTMQFFVAPSSYLAGSVLGSVGDFPIVLAADVNDMCFFAFKVPADYTTLTSVKISMIPAGTGTFDYTVTTDFGAAGEAYNANSDSLTADGIVSTNSQILELDVSASYTGIAANDLIGTAFTLDALGASTTQLRIIGMDVKYT
jgi:hypothetical protein